MAQDKRSAVLGTGQQNILRPVGGAAKGPLFMGSDQSEATGVEGPAVVLALILVFVLAFAFVFALHFAPALAFAFDLALAFAPAFAFYKTPVITERPKRSEGPVFASRSLQGALL